MRAPIYQLPLHPVLFGAYFVLFLYAENLDLVRLTEIRTPLTWAVGVSLLLLLAAGLVTRLVTGNWARGALIASALVVAFMAHGHVVELAGEGVEEGLLIGGWALLILVAVGLAFFPRTPIGSLTGGLNVIAVVLVAFTLTSIVPYNLEARARANDDQLEPSGLAAQRTMQRDIYYLVFDRYGSQSSLEAGFGITDNDLPDWLAERGFVVVDESHANYSRTSLSLASVLNLDYLDQLLPPMQPDSRDQGPIHRLLANNVVGRFLREQGYRYIHIGSWFNPTRTIAVADESIEYDSATEFEAVLYETTAMPLIDEHFAAEEEPMPPGDKAHLEHALFQFRAMDRVLSDPGPKFVVAHVLLPHDPYVFDEDGNYVSPAERADEPRPAQFRRQLEFTNRQIKAYVERLLARPASQRPIIIVSADEGPYPERYDSDSLGFDWSIATPAELETKFGIINAYYLPGEPDLPPEAPQPYHGMTAVNTFRMLLGRYFGLDLPYLPDRVYTSRSPRYVYDMTEVTQRLPTRTP